MATTDTDTPSRPGEREAKREWDRVCLDPEEQSAHDEHIAEIEHEHKPASRELVERMVREATAHSLWPVGIEWGDGAWAYNVLPNGREEYIIGVGMHRMQTMALLMERMEYVRKKVTIENARACPTCNGRGKTTGEIMWGEQDCHGCEGSGVR